MQAVSRRAAGEMRQLLPTAVAAVHEAGGPSKEEELVCFNLDFFVV